MNLFQEYQTLARSPTLTQQDLERMADIVALASEDDELFSAIMNFEYLEAQEAGLLCSDNIHLYSQEREKLLRHIEITLDSNIDLEHATLSKFTIYT